MENDKHIDTENSKDPLWLLRPEDEWRPDLTRGLALLRVNIERKQVHQSRLLWTMASIAAISILVMAFPTTRLLAARYASTCVSLFARLSGDTPNLAYTAVGLRKPAPDIALKDTSGASIHLPDLRGKVALLTFSKSDCKACDVEVSWFLEFERTYRTRNFVFLNQQLVDGGEDVLTLFGARKTIPTTFLIDKSGRVAVTHVGLCTKAEYLAAIEALINEPE